MSRDMLRNYNLALLKEPEDLDWLRDTVPAVREHPFVVALVFGNEDCPEKIILAERDHYRSAAVVLTLLDDGGYSARKVADLHAEGEA